MSDTVVALHATSRVELAATRTPAAEERLEAEFDVAHAHARSMVPSRSSPAKEKTSAVTARRWPFCASIRSSSRVWSFDGFSVRQKLIY